MSIDRLKPGDWIGTIGQGGLSEPVYRAIRAYSRGKYPITADNPNPVWYLTHARLAMDAHRHFEMTLPVGRFQTNTQAHLAEKFEAGLVRVARFPNARFDEMRLMRRARYWDGKPYDVGDLINIGLSGLLGVWNRVINIVGIDKRKRFAVCSTCAADILQFAVKGDLPLWPVASESIDPNAPFNKFGRPFAEAVKGWWNPIDITHLLTRDSFR